MTTTFGLCDDCATVHRDPVQRIDPSNEPTVRPAECAARAKVLAALIAA